MVPAHRALMSDSIESDESIEAFRSSAIGSNRMSARSEAFVFQPMTLSRLFSILSRSLYNKSKIRARRQDTTAWLIRLESTFDDLKSKEEDSKSGQLEMVWCKA